MCISHMDSTLMKFLLLFGSQLHVGQIVPYFCLMNYVEYSFCSIGYADTICLYLLLRCDY